MEIVFNKDKFKALIHYVCRSCINSEKLGAVKFHKILWLSDIYAYKHKGIPITGEAYKKNKYGPFSIHFDSIIKELEKDGKLYVHKVDIGNDMEKTQFVGKGAVDTTLFTEWELQVINDSREYVLENHTAGSISDKTHDAIWEMALMHEPIPYEATLVSRFAEVTDEDISWAEAELDKIIQ